MRPSIWGAAGLTLFLLLPHPGGAAQKPPDADRRLEIASDELLLADSALTRTRDERDRAASYLEKVKEALVRLERDLEGARKELDRAVDEEAALEGRILASRERILFLAASLDDLRRAVSLSRRRCSELEKRCGAAKEEEAARLQRELDQAREALRRLHEEERRLCALLAAEELELARCETRLTAVMEERDAIEGRVEDFTRALDSRKLERTDAEKDLAELEDRIPADEARQAAAMVHLGDVRLERDASRVSDLGPPEVLSAELVDADGDGRFSPGETVRVRFLLAAGLRDVPLEAGVQLIDGPASVLRGRAPLPVTDGVVEAGTFRLRPDAPSGSRVAVLVSIDTGKLNLFSRVLFVEVRRPSR